MDTRRGEFTRSGFQNAPAVVLAAHMSCAAATSLVSGDWPESLPW